MASASGGENLQPGQRLARYELVRLLGEGGFASVWLARLRGRGGFEKLFAIKVIRGDHLTDARFEAMFVDEARIAARIEHPNVARILELGEDGGRLYLVMEHVPGHTLERLRQALVTRGERIPTSILLRVLADTCAGLHAAHELRHQGRPLGIVHRDVSPHNILISESGVAKLIDFGVAKADDRTAAETDTGMAKGKVRYMAPEQALCQPLDRRVDIWAVGAVAYEILAGRPAHDGINEVARILSVVQNRPIDPFVTPPPPAIEAIIRRTLQHRPDERYATAAELRTAIEDGMAASGLVASTDDVAAYCAEVLGRAPTPGAPWPSSPPARGRSHLRELLVGGSEPADDVRRSTVELDGHARAAARLVVTETTSSRELIARALPRRRLPILAAAVAGAMLVTAGAWGLLRARPSAREITAGPPEPTPHSRAEIPPPVQELPSADVEMPRAPVVSSPVVAAAAATGSAPSTARSAAISIAPRRPPHVSTRPAQPPPTSSKPPPPRHASVDDAIE